MAHFSYKCTKGHEVRSPRPVDKCPVCIKGKPCDGVLGKVGRQPGQTSRRRRQ